MVKKSKAKFDFPKQKGFQTRSAIFVPSTTDVNKPIPQREFNKRINETRKFLNKRFGGSTTVRATGSFNDSRGKIVNERVAVVEHYTDYEDWKKQDAAVRKYLKSKRKQWKQESVGFEFQAPTKKRRLLFIS